MAGELGSEISPTGLSALAEEVAEAAFGGRAIDLMGLSFRLSAMALAWERDSISRRRANLRVVGGLDVEGRL